MLFYETNHRKERNDGKDTPLTVTEQHTHGIDLHRNTPGIPQGIDAAVAEGRLDLKVKNNTAYTFQIQISVDKISYERESVVRCKAADRRWIEHK